MPSSSPSLLSVNTPHPADSLSVLPGNDVRGSVLACGVYRLIESTPQRRVGGVVLYDVDANGPTLTESLQYEGAGILDLKWTRTSLDNNPVLAVADAEGCVALFEYDRSERRLSPSSSVVCSSTAALALSLSLRTESPEAPEESPHMLSSLSTGEIAYVIPTSSGLALDRSWQAHDYEAWVVSWAKEGAMAYSGSDDLTLKGWDLRARTDEPTFVVQRFEAGITSIHPSPWEPHHIAVGSYDSLVRVFDVRSPYKPLHTHSVSGGAWRLSYHPSPERKNQVLVAAMHGGAEVLHVGENADDDQRTQFQGHESMCYGAEWLTTTGVAGEDLVASCSFYDQKLCLWKA